MYQITDGPGTNTSLSVTDAASVEVKVGAEAQPERKIVIIQPQNGRVYWGYSNSVSSSNGFLISKKQTIVIEATTMLPVYIIAESGTVDVRIAEVS